MKRKNKARGENKSRRKKKERGNNNKRKGIPLKKRPRKMRSGNFKS